MVYKTQELVTKVVKPSEIYMGRMTKEQVHSVLKDYKVEDFRPPQRGEYYLGLAGRVVRRGFNDMYLIPGPRFIVTPRKIWE